MSTKKSRHVLSEAVRQLRESLAESQMDFAKRMNWHIVTLARYETSRPPKGRALAELWRAAYEAERYDLAHIFLEGFREEVGEVLFSAPRGFEQAAHAFVLVLASPKFEQKRAKILKLLEPEIKLVGRVHTFAEQLMDAAHRNESRKKGKKQ